MEKSEEGTAPPLREEPLFVCRGYCPAHVARFFSLILFCSFCLILAVPWIMDYFTGITLSDTVVYVLWTVAAVDLLLFFWLPKNMLEEPSGPEFRFFGAYFTVDALPVSYALVASVEEREGRAAERKRGLTAVDILLDPKELAARGMTKEAWAHVSELAFPHLSRARWPDSWLCIEGVLASDFPYARIGDIVKKYRQTEARDDGNAGF